MIACNRSARQSNSRQGDSDTGQECRDSWRGTECLIPRVATWPACQWRRLTGCLMRQTPSVGTGPLAPPREAAESPMNRVQLRCSIASEAAFSRHHIMADCHFGSDSREEGYARLAKHGPYQSQIHRWPIALHLDRFRPSGTPALHSSRRRPLLSRLLGSERRFARSFLVHRAAAHQGHWHVATMRQVRNGRYGPFRGASRDHRRRS